VDTATFVGRSPELAKLRQWIGQDGCRLVALLGMGGVGKTMLAAQLAEQLRPHFQRVLWRSLKQGPAANRLLQDLLQTLGGGTQANAPADWDDNLQRLVQQLRQQRCLMVLDHAETLLEPGQTTGDYRSDYRDYGDLFRALGDTPHASCILLTSREKPKEWIVLEGPQRPVRSLRLSGMTVPESQTLLATKTALIGTNDDWQQFVDRYGGNPLALQLAATVVADLFAGRLNPFLSESSIVFDDSLTALLQEQWQRLSAAERLVMDHLALERDDCTLPMLQSRILHKPVKSKLIETMNALLRRSLVEKKTRGETMVFRLQPVVSEFVTQTFVETVSQELIQGPLNLLHRCAFLNLNHKDYLLRSQQQAILRPILERLAEDFPALADQETHLRHLLHTLQQLPALPPASAAVSNVLNLCIEKGISLQGYDLSGLALGKLNLESVPLQGVNLAHCDLSGTRFANAFGGVRCAALSPRGQWLVTGHEDGDLRLWDTDNGRQLRLMQGHRSWVWHVAWTPDGQSIVSASEDQNLRVWDSATGDSKQTLAGHTARIWRVACSPDNRTAISASGDGTLKIWALQTEQCRHTLSQHQGNVTALAIRPDGQEAVSGGEDQTLRRWDLNTGTCLDTWTSTSGQIWAVAYHPDGQTVFSGSDQGMIEVWQVGQSAPIRQWPTFQGRIWSLDVSPCGQYVISGGEQSRLNIWMANTGHCHRSLEGHNGPLWSVQYSSDGDRMVSASDDRTVRIWATQSAQGLMTWQGHTNWACEVVFVPPGKQGERTFPLRLASAHEDGYLRLWDLQDHAAQILPGHQHQVWFVAVDKTGLTLASGGEDKTIRLWDLATGQLRQTLRGHESRVWAVSLSPDGRFLASGSGDRTVKIWQVETGACLWTLSGHASRVWSVAFSPDGRFLASGSGDRTVKIWQVKTGACQATLEDHTGGVLSVAFHPHQPWLITGGEEGCCKIWQTETWTVLATVPVPERRIWSLAISPDGQTLALGCNDPFLRRWNFDQAQWLQPLAGHTGWIWSVAFSPDGQQLASSSQDGSCRIWDAVSGQCLAHLQPQRLYEGLNLFGATGLMEAQKETLKTLGAIEQPVA
ncbi:MAG: NB-ARC domain-containing protein, partial [Thermosynechococcaceae cyanobacterium]